MLDFSCIISASATLKKRTDVPSVVGDVNEQTRLSGRCRLGRFENNPHAVGSCDSLCVSVTHHCRCLLNVINPFDDLQSTCKLK